ncbi:MAG: peptidylprolyl isomerase [Pyrinomonadaceae bacterium]
MKLRELVTAVAGLICAFALVAGQQTPVDPQKANPRTPTPPAVKRPKPEPFDGASVERMNSQCVTLESAEGNILLEMYADAAPETVRNFLNLVSIGAFDTTVFNRVVKDFVVQGGSLGAHEKLTRELVDRGRRTIPDEPNYVKHERGVLSMARPDTPNGATTDFFILIRDAKHLDGTFAAFGRVRTGMEIVDRINAQEVNGDKPAKPVRIARAIVSTCPAAAPVTPAVSN